MNTSHPLQNQSKSLFRSKGEDEGNLKSAGITSIQQCKEQLKEFIKRYSDKHKDLHGSISKIGKVIDKVFIDLENPSSSLFWSSQIHTFSFYFAIFRTSLLTMVIYLKPT